MIDALLIVVVAQLPSPSTTPSSPASDHVISQWVEILEADPDALQLFRGYDKFLHEHPDLLNAERSKFQTLPHESYRALATPFEAQLFASPKITDRFLNYLYAADTDPRLSRALNAINQTKINRRTSRNEFFQGLHYLQSNPRDAAIFLDRPHRLQRQPAELQPLRTLFRSEFDLRENLNAQFADLWSQPAAESFVQPWWETAYDQASPLSQAYILLESYLLKNPQRHETWTQWTQAWADHPDAWAWTAHQHADLASRSPEPSQYNQFLQAYFGNSQLRNNLNTHWTTEFGLAPNFPPADKAPPIPTEMGSSSIIEPRPSRTGVSRPKPPDIPRISGPQRPTRPVIPSQPRPSQPPRPKAPPPNSGTP